jgi:hypothetical protein
MVSLRELAILGQLERVKSKEAQASRESATPGENTLEGMKPKRVMGCLLV